MDEVENWSAVLNFFNVSWKIGQDGVVKTRDMMD